MEDSYLLSEKTYLSFVQEACPEIEDYVQVFLNIGFNHKTVHDCLKDMYKGKCANIMYASPNDTVAIKTSSLFFDETLKISNNIAKYLGDGTYYHHDTGSITKYLENMSFTEFLVNIGLKKNIADEIENKFKDYHMIPSEYVVYYLSYVNEKLFPNKYPDPDKENVIRWGRKFFRRYVGMESYLLNIDKLKEFILEEENSEFIKTMLDMLVEEFPYTKLIRTMRSLLLDGTILGKSKYDEMNGSNLVKCRKYVVDNMPSVKKPIIKTTTNDDRQ